MSHVASPQGIVGNGASVIGVALYLVWLPFGSIHCMSSVQSRDYVARSQNPEIVFQSRECAANLEIA